MGDRRRAIVHVTEHHDDRGCLVRLRGSLDVRTTADLRLHLHRVIAAGSSPVIKKDPGKAAYSHAIWEAAQK